MQIYSKIEPFISLKKAAEFLGLRYRQILDLRDTKKLKYKKIGGRFYTTESWIQEFQLGKTKPKNPQIGILKDRTFLEQIFENN